MDIICTECGYKYPSFYSTCPECGCPTSFNTQRTNYVKQTSCPNCGAPVTNGLSCEYCGTAYVRQTNAQQTSNNSVDVGVAAFLGGVVGGILGSD